MSGNDFKKIYTIKSISENASFTSKILLKEILSRRYGIRYGISVGTKVLKINLILKNDVSSPCRYSEGIRCRYQAWLLEH